MDNVVVCQWSHPRPVVPADEAAVVALGSRCSRTTLSQRFLAGVPRLLPPFVERTVRPLPGDVHLAVADLATGCLVALGSWVPNGPGSGEAGLLVEDAHQRRGIGTLLLRVLARVAADRGHWVLEGHVLTDRRYVAHRVAVAALGPVVVQPEAQGTSTVLRLDLRTATTAVRP